MKHAQTSAPKTPCQEVSMYKTSTNSIGFIALIFLDFSKCRPSRYHHHHIPFSYCLVFNV
nr:hypothetical protein Itr_chr09CG10460 [Ipomoea trifida]